MAGIQLHPSKVQKIIDSLDVNRTGNVNWLHMVGEPVSPYFFDGKKDFEVRQLL